MRRSAYIPILCIVAFTIALSGCTSPNVAAPTAVPSAVPSMPAPAATAAPTATASPAQAPSAYFTASHTADSPKTVSFTDESLNSPTSWAWEFGDGFVSSEPSPVHIYKDTGDYRVSLTVTNAAGHDKITQTVSVKATPIPTFSG